ncbi:MAG TPA: MMPL family transporter [Streptosporangiaceae bacterium]|nr:MMPL family transporter [Streptosporangiaceae bacterium]
MRYPSGLLGRTGLACYRRRWLIVVAWLAGLACLITLWTRFGAPADNDFGTADPGQAMINAHFHRQSGDALTLAIRSAEPVTSPAVRREITAALIPFSRAAGVSSVVSPYQAPGQISRDGHIAFATIQFSVPSTSIPGSEATALMHDATAASRHGLTFSLGGDVVDLAETPYGGASDGIGILAAAIVLLLAFGSVLAMGLPVVTALFGIGTGLSLIALIGHLIPAPTFSPIVASMIGLGIGVDYALFMVTRFREALRSGAAPETALVTTMRTAGRSVLTAGATVAIGMLGLLVLRQPLLNGVAVAAAATVAMTVLAALTLLPALLGFTGTRLARPSRLRLRRRRRDQATSGRPESRPGAALRWAAVVQRRPVLAAAVATGIIALLAVPALGMKLSMPDESAQARGTMGYASYATMADGFGPGFDAPLIVAAHLPDGSAGTGSGDTAGIARLTGALRAAPGIAAVTPAVTSRDGQAAMIIAYPITGEQDPATNALVNRLNDTVLPQATAGTGIRAYLTGPNAGNVAFANVMGERLPWLVAVVVLVSLVLLMVVFRSVTVAVKAAVMNLLSISAAYGVLVMISQHGWGRQLFGFPEAMPVTTWVPVFLFVILFGLSMDYEVFLLSRIREAYDATGDNAGSVAAGLASTARVITAAAAIMVVVFLSFVLGANVSVKQVGLGLAVAVLIDATVVRLVLVPAVMELLGKANWWLPRPLARILPGRPATQPGSPATQPGSPATQPGAAAAQVSGPAGPPGGNEPPARADSTAPAGARRG